MHKTLESNDTKSEKINLNEGRPFLSSETWKTKSTFNRAKIKVIEILVLFKQISYLMMYKCLVSRLFGIIF